MNKHSNILQRAKLICNSNGIMLHKYLFSESYARKCKLQFKCNVTDVIADSIYTLFLHFSQYLTRLLPKPFKYPIIYLIFNNTSINNMYLNLYVVFFHPELTIVTRNFLYYTYNFYLFEC